MTSVALIALAATSCDDNKNDWDKNTMNLQTESPVIVIPVSSADEPYFVNDYRIRFSQSLEDGKVSVRSMTPITLPDGSSFTFETPATNITGNQLTNIINPVPY